MDHCINNPPEVLRYETRLSKIVGSTVRDKVIGLSKKNEASFVSLSFLAGDDFFMSCLKNIPINVKKRSA